MSGDRNGDCVDADTDISVCTLDPHALVVVDSVSCAAWHGKILRKRPGDLGSS